MCFAFIEPVEEVSCTPEEVIAACQGEIADYKVPRRVIVVEEFPRTTTNKIQRYVLQARAAEITANSDS